MKLKFKIKGLDCANCAAELERGINRIDGVESASLSFMTERLEINIDEERKEELVKSIKKFIKKEEPDVTIEEA